MFSGDVRPWCLNDDVVDFLIISRVLTANTFELTTWYSQFGHAYDDLLIMAS